MSLLQMGLVVPTADVGVSPALRWMSLLGPGAIEMGDAVVVTSLAEHGILKLGLKQ